MMKLIISLICALSGLVDFAASVKLVAYISQNGLHGEIHFRQHNSSTVEITAKLETTLQYPDQVWSWGIHRFPVDYSQVEPRERCSESKIGESSISFDDDLGYLTLPGNETATWLKAINLTGNNGIWGKSLVLLNENLRICATITTVDQSLEHMAEARFNSPLAGSVYFRWLASTSTDLSDTLIYTDLYHIQDQRLHTTSTDHSWKIYVTDIFEHDHHRNEENCNFLQLVFDPMGSGQGKGLGDLDVRLGKIKVATNALREEHRSLYRDRDLVLLPSDLTIPHRTLYLVLFDHAHPDNFLACAKIRHIPPIMFKTLINSGGIKGEIAFKQRSRFDPTFLNITISAASNTSDANLDYAKEVSSIRIHTLPPSPLKIGQDDHCQSSAETLNPRGLPKDEIPPPGYGTQDQYPVGDLTGKLQSRNKDYYHNYILPGASSELSGIYWDTFLPLQGSNSINHRGLVMYKYNRTDVANITESPWGCGTVLQYQKNGYYQKPVFTAQVLFRYPIVGRILLRQPKDEPWHDTVVIVEYLTHADGSTQSSSEAHRWAIHNDPPGKDFYDWQKRCISAGEIYNPYGVQWHEKNVEDYCKPNVPGMCRLGDTHNRLGTLKIAGSRNITEKISRTIYIDSNLPLSGRRNILGKAFVIYDDFGPKARGERLACSIISGHSRRKVVAKDWYPNGAALTAKGKLEIVQQSEYDLTNIEVDLKGLVTNKGYHIHMTPVEANLEFPCEDSSLYGHFNPFNVDPKTSPAPKNGTTDEYEMGDLSGKFGTLEGLTQYEDAYNDTNLPLYGYNSIIGRSVIIHKKQKKARWACSTLERGYSPSEAREIRAIASFHNPNGYAFGYMRMTQLIHNDGGQSDTVIEVKLRHPGKNDRNMTQNHKWQIFVNPVGVDATVKQTITRCVAGGYVWNPYYTQLADPLNTELYEHECGPDNPLRCYVGDVSARIGTIDLGGSRVVVSDPNFPLEGTVSAIGRSVVIFGPERSWERYACANIEPDHDIVKYINLQKPPRFVVQQFLEDVRQVMGIPEWMMDIDARKTKQLHGGACIQMIMHFKGPIAHKLEVDFSGLMLAGRLDAPSLFVPGYYDNKRKPTVSYRTCGVRDPTEKKTSTKTFLQRSSISGSAQSKTGAKWLIILVCMIFVWNRD